MGMVRMKWEELVECCELDGSDKLGWSSGKGKKENRVLVKRDEQERSRKALTITKALSLTSTVNTFTLTMYY